MQFAFALLLLASAAFGQSVPRVAVTGSFAAKATVETVTVEQRLEAVDRALEKIQKKPLANPTPIVSHETYGAYQPWYEYVNGVRHNTSADHLVHDHGADPNLVSKLSIEQRNRLHGKMHGEKPSPHVSAKPTPEVRSPTVSRAASPPAPPGFVRGNCPGGFCPLNSGVRYGRRGKRG